MNITIDTSALIAVITDEPKKGRIIELTIGANLISPHSVHWEIGNAFSAMLKRNRTHGFHCILAILQKITD